jgi:hypothetical protein
MSDLNLVEGIWSLLKRSMANFAAADQAALVRSGERKLARCTTSSFWLGARITIVDLSALTCSFRGRPEKVPLRSLASSSISLAMAALVLKLFAELMHYEQLPITPI